MPVRRLKQDELDRIVDMRERGCSHAMIARVIGCSESAVWWQCLRLCAEPPKPPRPLDGRQRRTVVMRKGLPVRAFTPEDDARLLALEAEGLSDTAIGRAMGRRPNSVRGRMMTLARRDARAEVYA